MRFGNNLLNKTKKNHEQVSTVNEFNYAYKLWIQDEQAQLSEQSNYAKMSDSLYIFVDNSRIVRLRGRFENCALNYDERSPALLRSDSYFTYLLILHAHENVFHQGIEAMLNYTRSKFCLIEGRKTVKNVLRKCVTCKRFQTKTLIPPGSPDLPDFRVNSTYCFQYTGLDYAGPLFVKDISKTNTSKVYILLLTCATSRAVHLELTPNMNVPAFLRCPDNVPSNVHYKSTAPCLV